MRCHETYISISLSTPRRARTERQAGVNRRCSESQRGAQQQCLRVSSSQMVRMHLDLDRRVHRMLPCVYIAFMYY